MLQINRKEGEWVEIGDSITVTVTRLEKDSVRLRIDAPIETDLRLDDSMLCKLVPKPQPTGDKALTILSTGKPSVVHYGG